MVAWYSKLIIRSSSVSFFHWHPLTVYLMRRSRSAVVSDSSCLKSARYSVSEMPKWSWLFEALLEKRPIPDLPSYGPGLSLQECPSSCMLRHLLPQVWGPTASPQVSGLPRRSHCIRRLKSFHAATLSAALQFISGYFSLGTDGMISAIRRSFQDHEGKLNESYLCDKWRW